MEEIGFKNLFIWVIQALIFYIIFLSLEKRIKGDLTYFIRKIQGKE